MTGALDICVCGDYRHQHKDGGRCTVCPVSPQLYPDCEQFRLAGQPAESIPRPVGEAWPMPSRLVNLGPAPTIVLPNGSVLPVQRAVDATYVPRPCELDDDPTEWHVVRVDQRMIVCADGCDGPEPHLNEHRALDVQGG